ncbi:MAG TPA: F420-dependent glucose-6-phosphate dehydrogenase [Chloroflexi bacterium]|nr:F420-dependent glucose-6-phosphate dehydrogenase [Chloroflexota bacterium]HAL27819.1 F420-dependent glucose-6-phosphate dehydrogenase [Chloroflexota bacterium]
MLTLGWKASAEQFGPHELLDYGIAAEKHGFDSIVVSDHFHPWKDTDGHAPFSFAWLGAMGARTTRARLGTSVVTPTFRYHPAIVAQAFATLGVLFPGRVFLGVGSGESMNETPVTGREWPPPGERLRRLGEAVELIKELWSDDYVTWKGRHYRTEAAKIFDKPKEPVPIFIAAAGPKAAEQVGKLGDGFICTSGKGIELYRDVLLPNLEKGAREAGRDAATIEKMIEIKVSYDADRDRALADTREWAALALPAEDKAGVEDPREMERRAAGAADNAHSRFIVTNDPDECVAEIEPYLALGFTHLVFHFPGKDQERAMAHYAAEVLPLLRKHP